MLSPRIRLAATLAGGTAARKLALIFFVYPLDKHVLGAIIASSPSLHRQGGVLCRA